MWRGKNEIIYSLAWIVVFLLIIVMAFSCAGIRKSSQEPAHAESGGIAATIWKIPVIGIGGWGLDYSGASMPSVIIHQYSYQAQPAPTPPSTPPSPPTHPGPTGPTYPTVYASAWDDPTLVVFVNRSYRVVKIQIGGEPEIRLEPYQATANLHLAPGEYLIRKTIERPTKMGTVFDWVTFFRINVRLDGRSQIIYLYDY